MDNNMVRKLELECLLLIFIYSNSNSRSLAKTWTSNAGSLCTSELIPKKNHLSNITAVILPFSHKNTIIFVILSTLESTRLLIKPSYAL